MKSLRARVTAGFGSSIRFVGAITMLWAMALGQATPDVPIPEPAVLPLMGLGVAVLVLMYRRKK